MTKSSYQTLALLPVENPLSQDEQLRSRDAHQDAVDVGDEGAAVHGDVNGRPLVVLGLFWMVDDACITTRIRTTTKAPSAELAARRANEDTSAFLSITLSVVDDSIYDLSFLYSLLIGHDYFSASHGTSGPPIFSKSIVMPSG